ncbi:bis(5'-nucleosyl)-tetraphosphatase (symmetrical) YqeK, partial [Senegalimassilia anaerobia]
ARREDLAHRVKRSRFEHSLGVSETAARMARVYGQDEHLARLAGLLHDWDKGYDDEGIRARAVELGIADQLASYLDMPHLLHGPTAAAALAREFPELPAPLLQAIRLHTTGAVGMSPLDLIVYVADVIEPGRYCAGVDKLRDMVGKVELEELFMATLVYVVGNLIERRKLIHPGTVTVWNYYVARARERAAANDAKGSK